VSQKKLCYYTFVNNWQTFVKVTNECIVAQFFDSLCIDALCNVTSHPGQLSLVIPSWVGAMSTSQREVRPCGWGVKAGMVRVWVAGKTV